MEFLKTGTSLCKSVLNKFLILEIFYNFHSLNEFYLHEYFTVSLSL